MVVRLRISNSLRPPRRVYLGRISLPLVQQAPADGGGRRNPALLNVRLFGRNQLVGDFDVLLKVIEDNGGSIGGPVPGYPVEVDHGHVGQSLAELSQFGVEDLLPLLGRLVFGIFAQVAQRNGFLQLFRELLGQLVLYHANFFFQFPLDVNGHGSRCQSSGSRQY